MPEVPETLSRPEAAERLGVDVRTLGRMIGLGQLPVVRVGARERVPTAAVDEFLRVSRATRIGAEAAFRAVTALVAAGWTPPRTGGGR